MIVCRPKRGPYSPEALNPLKFWEATPFVAVALLLLLKAATPTPAPAPTPAAAATSEFVVLALDGFI